MQIDFDVSVEQDGVVQDGTILWTTIDLDIDDRFTNNSSTYSTDGTTVPYAESMEIISGAESYAVTPYYDHTGTGNYRDPLGFQIDSENYDGMTANGVRFFAATRPDKTTFDSGFATLISSKGTSMRWTGSKENKYSMGTRLFNESAQTRLEMTHGTGGGIYLESYKKKNEGDNECTPYMIENLAAAGLYAKPTVTVVPEDGYRVKDIYVDEASSAGTTKYTIYYDDDGNAKYMNDTSHAFTDGKGKVEIDGITFEINSDGTVDVTLPSISTPKHVHADFDADYYFEKIWKVPTGSNATIPDKLELKATPFVFEMTSVEIDGTKYDISEQGTKYTAPDGTEYVMNSALALTIGDKQYQLHGNVLKLLPEETIEYPIEHTITSGTTQEFTVNKTRDKDFITVEEKDGETIWKIKYPAAGRQDVGWPALPIETEPSAHNYTHVERNYWFVTEVSPDGWAMVDYDNDKALAPGVVTAKDSYTKGDESKVPSIWRELSVVYHDATEELIEAQEAKDHAFMSPLSSEVTGVDGTTKYKDWGGKITNYPALVIKAEKEWEDDFTNDFNTRQDVLFHIDAVVNNETITDFLAPIKISKDETTTEKLTGIWGNKKPYTTAEPNVEIITDASALPYTETEGSVTYEISYVPVKKGSPGLIATSVAPDGTKGPSDGKIYYTNELPIYDSSGNVIQYSIRETSTVKKEGSSSEYKDIEYEDIIGYTTKWNGEEAAECKWNKLTDATPKEKIGSTEVPTKYGKATNTLIREDFTINKKWLSPKTAEQLKDLETTMQKAVTISATPAEGNAVVVNKDGEDAYTGYKSDASKKDYYNWPTGDNATVSTDGKTYTYTWKDLPSYLPVTVDDKTTLQKVTYSAVETELDDFQAPTYKNTDTTVTDKALSGGTITNTQLIKVSVVKIWDDADNQDGKRGNIGVTLYQNGDKYTPTVTDQTNEATLEEGNATKSKKTVDDDTWTWTDVWTQLPYADANGSVYNYTATETKKPGDYTSDQSASQIKLTTWNTDNDTLTFEATNKHDPEKVSFTVTKTWNDASNQDGKRPENGAVTYTIKAQSGTGTATPLTELPTGAKITQGETDITSSFSGGSITVNTDNGTTITLTDLDKYAKAGNEITYTVEETQVTDYEAPVITGSQKSGFTVKNSYTPETASVKVIKQWDDSNNQDGLRVGTIAFTIKGSDSSSNTQPVTISTTADDNTNAGEYTWANLPVYKDGNKITYTVTEDTVPGGYGAPTYAGTDDTKKNINFELTKGNTYEVTVTNKHTPNVPPEATPMLSKDGQYNSTDGSLKTQTLPADTVKSSFTAKGTLPDGTANEIDKIELDVPDGVEGATKNADGSVTVPGEGTYRLNSDGSLTFTPVDGFTGMSKGVKVVGTDKLGQTVSTTYNPIVVPNKQTQKIERIVEYRYTDENGNEVTEQVTQTADIELIGDYDASKDSNPTTYSDTDPDTTINYDGKSWKAASLNKVTSPTDSGGWVPNKTELDAISNITPDTAEQLGFTKSEEPDTGVITWKKQDLVVYTPQPPKPNDTQSWGRPGQKQSKSASELFSVTTSKTAADDDGDREDNEIVDVKLIDPDTGEETDGPVNAYDKDGNRIGTYEYDPSTGLVTFTPIEGYDGEEDPLPVKVKATDKNGLSTTGEYQPHFKPYVETKTEKRTITYLYDDGTPVLDANGNPVTVVQEVTFTRTAIIDPDTGEQTWTDWDPAITSVDSVGSPSADRSVYTPTDAVVDGVDGITPDNAADKLKDITIIYHKPPVAGEKKTYGGVGDTQTGTPEFTEGSSDFTKFMLIDPETGEEVSTITIAGEGRYTIDPNTGEVTFVPEADFVGVATKVTVRATDENGYTADGYYTPTVVDNTETRTVKRTIEYLYDDGTPVLDKDGNPIVDVETKTFTRTGKVDPETGTVTWEAWTPQSYSDDESEKVTGYTPDQKTVKGHATTPDDGDENVKVIYTKSKYTVTYLNGDHGTSNGSSSIKEYGDNPQGNTTTPDSGYKFTGRYKYVITDEDGNVIAEGETDDPESIEVIGNIVFTPIYVKDEIETETDPSTDPTTTQTDPTTNETTTTQGTGGSGTYKKVPMTGDTGNMALYVTLCAVSAAAIPVTFILARRKNYRRRR